MGKIRQRTYNVNDADLDASHTREQYRLDSIDLARRMIATHVGPEALAGYAAAWASEQSGSGDPVVCCLTSLRMDRFGSADRRPLTLWLGEPRGTLRELFDCCADIIAPCDLDRARQFRREADARMFLAAHAALRLLLADALDCAPADLVLGIGAHGKPTIAAVGGSPAPADVQFNLSHSGERILIGIAAAPVGVDIETVREFPDRAGVARLAFAREALAALDDRTGAAQLSLFYRFWVLGEAYIKATGLGIAQGLDSFCFTVAGTPRLTTATPGLGPPERWRFGMLAG